MKNKFFFTTKKYSPLMLLTAFLIVLFFGVGQPLSLALPFGNNTLKFAQISDVHLDLNGSDKSRRLFADSEALLKDAVRQVNSTAGLDFAMFTGDAVNKPLKEDFNKFLSIVKYINVPWYIAPGNHDIGVLGGISKEAFVKAVSEINPNLSNLKKSYYAFCPKNGYMVVVLDAVIGDRIASVGYLPEEQLDWLRTVLSQNRDKKVIIAMHHAPMEPVRSVSHKLMNSQELFEIIDSNKNVISVLSGHYHITKIIKRNGVLYICTPSLIEYPNAFRVIKITAEKNNIKYNISFRETGRKDLLEKSKSRTQAAETNYGKQSDRNVEIIMPIR